jgi:hypothetical protein
MTKLSIASLSLRTAAAVKVPYVTADGTDTGVVLHVLPETNEAVQRELTLIGNSRRKRDHERASDPRAVVPVEEDQEDIVRMVACRLAGWDGIEEPWTPEHAISLVRANPEIAELVTTTSRKNARFTKSSPKA